MRCSLCVVVLMACGPEAVLMVKVDSTMSAKTEVDTLALTVTRDGRRAGQVTIDVQSFPLSYALYEQQVGGALAVDVVARLEGTEVARASQVVTLRRRMAAERWSYQEVEFILSRTGAGTDGGADAGVDGGADAGIDGGADAGADGGVDAGTPDSGWPGLLAHYTFDDAGGGTVNDRIGRGPPMMLRGAWRFEPAGRRGGAVLFGLSNDAGWGALPEVPGFGGDAGTIAVWVKTCVGCPGWSAIVNKQQGTEAEDWIALGHDTGKHPYWVLNNGPLPDAGKSSAAVGGGALTSGEWHHLAATYDGRALSLFVDGQLVASNSSSRPLDLGPQVEITVGAGWNGKSTPNECLFGQLDELAFFSRALTGAEVAAWADGGS